MYTITIEGQKYIMGTRVPVEKVIEIYKEYPEQFKDVAVKRIQNYAKDEGYIIQTSLVESVIKESL